MPASRTAAIAGQSRRWGCACMQVSEEEAPHRRQHQDKGGSAARTAAQAAAGEDLVPNQEAVMQAALPGEEEGAAVEMEEDNDVAEGSHIAQHL